MFLDRICLLDFNRWVQSLSLIFVVETTAVEPTKEFYLRYKRPFPANGKQNKNRHYIFTRIINKSD